MDNSSSGSRAPDGDQEGEVTSTVHDIQKYITDGSELYQIRPPLEEKLVDIAWF